jgi:hypothetical protein
MKNPISSDFGLDKCVQYGKMVMGYKKAEHDATIVWSFLVIKEK